MDHLVLPDTDKARDSGDKRRAAVILSAAGVTLIACLWAVGWPLVNSDFAAPVRLTDAATSVHVVALRTPLWDSLTHIGSMLSDTFVCIAVASIAVSSFRLWLERWRESVMVILAIAGELILFLAVTGVIERARPMVPQLDPAPLTSSFPSGHTAAAVALYGAISIVILRHLRSTSIAMVIVTVCWLIPMIVGISRLYRGMHYLSDVVVGAVAGGVWLMVVVAVLNGAEADRIRSPGSA